MPLLFTYDISCFFHDISDIEHGNEEESVLLKIIFFAKWLLIKLRHFIWLFSFLVNGFYNAMMQNNYINILVICLMKINKACLN